jgi:hypothetical protein
VNGDHGHVPGTRPNGLDRRPDPKAVRDEYFKELERATAADPAAGRYHAYVLTVIFARG